MTLGPTTHFEFLHPDTFLDCQASSAPLNMSSSRPYSAADLEALDVEDPLNWTRAEFEIPNSKACGGETGTSVHVHCLVPAPFLNYTTSSFSTPRLLIFYFKLTFP